MAARRDGAGLVQRSKGRMRPVSVRIDEMAVGVPASSGVADAAKASALAQVRRTPDGTVADAQSAALLGQLGGRARAERERGLRVLTGLGLKGEAPEFLAPYLAEAEAFAMHEIARLARERGGGLCDAGPSSIIQSAALQLAGSRAAFAAGDTMLGSRLADASRANLLSAEDLCARQAQGRPKKSPADEIWERHLAERAAAAAAPPVDNDSDDAEVES